MKIVLIAPRFHTNQVELVEYLHSRGIAVEFWVTGFGASEDHSVVKPRLIRLAKFLGGKRAGQLSPLNAYTRMIPQPSEFLRVMRDDVALFIVRNPFTGVGLSLSIAARLKGAAVLFYTQREQHRPRSPKDVVARLLMKLVGAQWMTPCRGDLKHPTPIKEILFIPFCMKPAAYEKVWFRDNRVNLITVGKFLDRKNHLLLISALAPLAEEFRISLTIIGEVSDVTGDKLFETVQQKAAAAPYPVIIYPNISRARVFELYQECDIFVLAARNEPASVSNLEAMAYGLPVVTSTTNKTSCYTDGNGLVFESDSLDDLRAKLRKMIANRDEIVAMGKRSTELVKTNHSAAAIYGALLHEAGIM